MSQQYDEYLFQHRNGVYEAFEWMKKNIPDIFGDDSIIAEIDYQIKFGHDGSKNSPEEYSAYDAYFYGRNRSHQVVSDFNKAWLHHIHFNPHHWQHWILNNDNPEEGTILLPIPDNYIVEMICDWWSFSFAKGNLYEIFDWYKERANYMQIEKSTRNKINKILARMKEQLDFIKNNHLDPKEAKEMIEEGSKDSPMGALLGNLDISTEPLENSIPTGEE